jgi:signal transduction histidine kinase
MNTLRFRLVISHILPVLVVLPLLGFGFLAGIQRWIFLDEMGTNLVAMGALTADTVLDHPEVWTDPNQAAAYLTRYAGKTHTHVSLIRRDGVVIASTLPAATGNGWAPITETDRQEVLSGREVLRTDLSVRNHQGTGEVLVPVRSGAGDVIGIIRLTDDLSAIAARLHRSRVLVAWTVIPSLLLAALIGVARGMALEMPLQRIITALQAVRRGAPPPRLSEEGPAEVQPIARAYNQLVEHYTAADRERVRLMAINLHEVSRPIVAMRAATQALNRGADASPEWRGYLMRGIDGELNRLERSVEDMAQVWRAEPAAPSVRMQPLALEQWLLQTAGMWREAARQRQLGWQCRIDPNLPWVQADPDRLGQALGNLLANAVKYTPAGGSIALCAGAAHDGVTIAVQNSGPAIPPEEHRAIFDLFHRAPATCADTPGTGIGLTVVRELVEAHGGHLSLNTDPTTGNRFTIWLPVRPEVEPSAGPWRA